MFDKSMLENYKIEVEQGNIPRDLLDKLLSRWWEMRDILKEIDRIWVTVVEEGAEDATASECAALEGAFARVVKERMSDELMSK